MGHYMIITLRLYEMTKIFSKLQWKVINLT